MKFMKIHINKVILDKFDEYIIIASDGLWDVVEDQVKAFIINLSINYIIIHVTIIIVKKAADLVKILT